MFKPIDLFTYTLKILCDFGFLLATIYMRLSALSKPCTHCSTAEGHPVYVSPPHPVYVIPPLNISLFCDFHNISPLMITNAAVHKTYGQGKGMLLWVKQTATKTHLN